MKDTPVSIGPRLPTQELKPFDSLYNHSQDWGVVTASTTRQNERVKDAAQQVVALAECLPGALPEPLVASLANLHAALAGPGPSALDMRPQSLEVIGDEGLHARAMAEAKAREMGRDAEIIRAIETLPADVRHLAEGYDTQRAAHAEELYLSHHQGLQTGMTLGYDNALRDIASQPLWRIALNRFQAWWSSWS